MPRTADVSLDAHLENLKEELIDVHEEESQVDEQIQGVLDCLLQVDHQATPALASAGPAAASVSVRDSDNARYCLRKAQEPLAHVM